MTTDREQRKIKTWFAKRAGLECYKTWWSEIRVLQEIAKELNVETSCADNSNTLFDKILVYLKAHQTLLISGLKLLTFYVTRVGFHDEITRREQKSVDSFMELWEQAPLYLVMQPVGSSYRFLNTPSCQFFTHYFLLTDYIRQATGRLPSPIRDTVFGGSTGIGIVSSSNINTFLIPAMQMLGAITEECLNSRSDPRRYDPLENVLCHSIRFLRTFNHIKGDLSGVSFYFDTPDLFAFLKQVLPHISPEMPRALAEAHRLLNEIAIGAYPQHIIKLELMDEMNQRLMDEIFLYLIESLLHENHLWEITGEFARSDEALSLILWYYINTHHPEDWGFDFLNVLKKIYKNKKTEDVLTFFKARPLTAIVISRTNHLLGNAVKGIKKFFNLTSKELDIAINHVLPSYWAMPNSISYSTSYRSIVFSEMVARPPSHLTMTMLIMSGKIRLAASFLCDLWTKTASELHLCNKEIPLNSESYFKWKHNISKAAFGAVQDRVNKAFDPIADLSKAFDSSNFTPHYFQYGRETLFNELKARFSEFFCWQKQPSAGDSAIALNIDKGMHVVDNLIRDTRQYDVDIIFIGLSNGGVCALVYKSKDEAWIGVEGIESISRGTLMRGMVRDWRSATDFSEPTVRQFATLSEISVQLTDMIIENANPGPRSALIITPELCSFPIVPVFARRLTRVHGEKTAVGEIEFNAAQTCRIVKKNKHSVSTEKESSSICRPFRECRFSAFADRRLTAGEIDWHSYGLHGETKIDFSADDIFEALSDGTELVHIIAHGHFDNESPMFSFLETTSDPLFSLDFIGAELEAKLLILNSCSSLAGGAFAGWHGGAPARLAVSRGIDTAVGNIIPVPTYEAEKTCKDFQKRLIQNGTSIAEAYTATVNQASKDRKDFFPLSLLGRSVNALFAQFFATASLNT